MKEILIHIINNLAPIIVAVTGTIALIIPLYKQKIELPKLKYHHFKNKLAQLKVLLQTSYHLSNKGKLLLSRDFLLFTISIVIKHLDNVADEIDSCSKTCSGRHACNKLLNLNLSTFSEIILDYNEFVKSENFTYEERETIDIFLEYFNEQHEEAIGELILAIEEICNDNYYQTISCRAKQAMIFDREVAHFSSIIKDTKQVMEISEGKLKSKRYKGEVI